MKKITSVAMGGALVAGLTAGTAMAAENPFGIQSLDGGYRLAMSDKSDEGKCGEGKCGDKTEAKCGEAKCGATTEAKCGEAKCGQK